MKTGGKQYKVKAGDLLKIERLGLEVGEQVQFNQVLMIGGDPITVGTPFVYEASVQAEIVDQIKGEKLINFVKRRRKHGSKRTKGHRQKLTLVRVKDIITSKSTKTGIEISEGVEKLIDSKRKKDEPKQKKLSNKAAAAKEKETASSKEKKSDNKIKEVADFTKLSGVGPAMIKKFKMAGIKSFEQIAGWSETEVKEIDEKYSFKGRIFREGWVEQAKKLAKTK